MINVDDIDQKMAKVKELGDELAAMDDILTDGSGKNGFDDAFENFVTSKLSFLTYPETPLTQEMFYKK